MKNLQLALLSFLISTSPLMSKVDVGVDPCIYSEMGIYEIKPVLEKSAYQTVNSDAWKSKVEKRRLQKLLRFGVYVVLPAVCAFLITANISKDIGAFCMLTAFVGSRLAYKSIKRMGETDYKKDVCEIEMQRMRDLRRWGYMNEAERILKFLGLRRQAADASGEDVGRYYAAQVGFNLSPRATESEREDLSAGPVHYWERFDRTTSH